MEPYSNVIYILGTAGSGKSALTMKFSEWLYDAGWSVIRVNMDPGVRQLPYTPDVDVRDYVNLDQIIEQYELGPNGALIAATDILVTKIDDIKQEIESFDADYIIVDTVGQMEVFAYRSSGLLFVTALSKSSVVVHLIDSLLAKTPASFVSMVLLGASLKVRFPIPQITVLSKTDLISEDEIERICKWSNPEFLADALEIATRGLQRELNVTLLNALKMQGYIGEVIPVSSVTMKGIDDLAGNIEHVFDSYRWDSEESYRWESE
ncbi:MAG: ATP/GTP-binding protein [Candidatus Lokiarchaeota archaeon]|nr:ATP/GTP-binding protein [Candidatus Lokiarchaeota archaeon]